MLNWVFECLSSWLNDCLSDRLMSHLPSCMTDWLMADGLPHWLTDCLIDWWATCLHDWLTDWLTDGLLLCMTDWSTDCLFVWSIDWLCGHRCNSRVCVCMHMCGDDVAPTEVQTLLEVITFCDCRSMAHWLFDLPCWHIDFCLIGGGDEQRLGCLWVRCAMCIM